MVKNFYENSDHRFLSNMVDCVVQYDGVTYRSVEHAYQAQKSHEDLWKEYCQRQDVNSHQVKRKSHRIDIRDDWEEVKLQIMADLLLQKFKQQPFYSKLLDLQHEYIQEGNYWGDTFWGVCEKTGEGRNVLGKLIMNIRNAFLMVEFEESFGKF